MSGQNNNLSSYKNQDIRVLASFQDIWDAFREISRGKENKTIQTRSRIFNWDTTKNNFTIANLQGLIKRKIRVR